MNLQTTSHRFVADVKCYHCGHVSGRMLGTPGRAPGLSDFVPRRGYQGAELKPGVRLRCERCSGPVFLEPSTGLPAALGRNAAVPKPGGLKAA